ncbi:MAG: 1-deoxy-D-xylulose-5-phosphate synthase [Clostridiales bacterium]|nr:1-deoxy-D-xylulose-5-phosphate synthase [Clostridiales bacterium]
MLPDEFQQINWTEMTDSEGAALCKKLREELVLSVSKTGGHLASNLGAVELTVALHRTYDTARDRLVFDVGHQCYCHKMLTGRAGMMDTMRMLNGLAGFPKPNESVHDAFVAGHASNSVSVALGMARARTQLGEDYDVVALIGDGALTGGLAYEGLSDAGQSGENLVVILNDNGMSIKKNVGGVAKLLSRHHLCPQYLRFKKIYRGVCQHIPGGGKLYRVTHKIKQAVKGSILPSSMFEDMGFTYLGPVNGHNLSELTRILRWAKELEGPVLVHVRTVKGKGYPPAEREPHLFHGVGPFDPATGKPLKPCGVDFSAVFGETLTSLAATDHRVCAITAAMQSGTGLDEFATQFPERCFDVGIAEGHAVALCGGMAKQGAVPVFAVYSTFLQRSYDMLIHDIALSNLHAVFGVDRAGLVGADGETHQGVFDLAYLSTVPGMTVLAPASFAELSNLLRWAVEQCAGPVAIRYPRGGENGYCGDAGVEPTVSLRQGSDLTIVTHGILTGEVLRAAERLEASGCSAEVLKLNRVHPIDADPVAASVQKTGRLLVAEEVIHQNCAGMTLAAELMSCGVQVDKLRMLNCGKGFIPHGTVEQQRQMLGISWEQIAAAGLEMMQ